MTRRNIVLVVLDAVRKDIFDQRATELCRRADFSFEQCRAASSWSTPSHASMFTGKLPHQHGIHTYQRSFSGLSREETFLGQLEDYATIGVTPNVFVGSPYGFDELFDEFININPRHPYPDSWEEFQSEGPSLYLNVISRSLRSGRPWEYAANAVSSVLRSRFEKLPIPSPYDNGAEPTIRAAVRRIEASTEPFFMFLNFMDVHQPLSPHLGFDRSLYSVPYSWSSKNSFYEVKWDINARSRVEEHEEFLSNYRELYGAAVKYLDRKVSALVDVVQRSTDRETTFVITSDHGENLGFETDDFRFEHTSSLSEALLHVPLCVINAPGRWDETVDSLVSQMQIGELVTGLAAGETRDVTDKRIAAEVMGLAPGNLILSENERRELGISSEDAVLSDKERRELDRTIRAAYDGESKYIWDSDGRADRYLLYPEGSSVQELVAAGTEVPEWATELFDDDVHTARSVATAASKPSDKKAPTQMKDRLRDLGYLG